MTKKVLVINGDSNATMKLVCEEWAKGDPNADPPVPPSCQSTCMLSNPADLDYFQLHSGSYLKVYEAPNEAPPAP